MIKNIETANNAELNPQGLMISDEDRETLESKGVVTIKLYPRSLKNIHPEYVVGQTIELAEPIGRPNQIDLATDNLKAIITSVEPADKNSQGDEQIAVTFKLIN